MYAGRTAVRIWETPDDDACDGQPRYTVRSLVQLYRASRGPIRQRWFGATLPELWAENEAALDRGLSVQAIFDKLQGAGPTEQKAVKACMASHPQPWQNHDFLLGTSMVAGKISHTKEVVVNAPVDGYAVPPGDFETVEDALAAGYPVTWWGSWNASPDAAEQSNTICIMPGIVVAEMVCGHIAAQRAFILANEMRYQPVLP